MNKILTSLKHHGMEHAGRVTPSINVGATLDIPTGTYEVGKYGEYILNGGLSYASSVIGKPNLFKSTILNYMIQSALDRVKLATNDTINIIHDTEMSFHTPRYIRMAEKFENLRTTEEGDIFKRELCYLTNKATQSADEWYSMVRKILLDRVDDYKKEKERIDTPFLNIDTNELIKIIPPTFSTLDSLTEFETRITTELLEKHDIGDSELNTIDMKRGKIKAMFLSDIPFVTVRSQHFIGMTAHVAEEIHIASPGNMMPKKRLQYLPVGEKIKGVSSKFLFLVPNTWYANHSGVLEKDGSPEYPQSRTSFLDKDTDLNLVSITQLRGKAGPSGYTLKLIVSQEDGVLPSLTEFHHIKERERFGITGSLQSYSLDLLPDVKIGRTTVRNKLSDIPELARAVNITSELLQMYKFYSRLPEELRCTPAELYNDIKNLGYDWKILLNSRGWYTLNNDSHKVPYLSTFDLLRMRKGLYKPYWY